MNTQSVHLILLASGDLLSRELALMDVRIDHPQVPVIIQDLRIDPIPGVHQRIHLGSVSSSDSPASPGEELIELEHLCGGCAIREIAIPALLELAEAGATRIVLALPAGLELDIALGVLEPHPRIHVEASVGVIDADCLETGLFGQLTMADSGSSAMDQDDRPIAEVLVGIIPFADVLVGVAENSMPPSAHAALDALRSQTSTLRRQGSESWFELAQACDGSHALMESESMLVPPRVGLPGPGRSSAGRQGVTVRGDSDLWAVTVDTSRPVHPQRLLEAAQQLSEGPWVGWGQFWVPDRPMDVCALQVAAEQMSIGVHGHWEGEAPRTRMQWVGRGVDVDAVERLLAQCLLNDTEMEQGWTPWFDRIDALAPYLGERGGQGQ